MSVCAFDKTGTLTSDDISVVGVIDLNKNEEIIRNVGDLEEGGELLAVLAACHELVYLNDKVTG